MSEKSLLLINKSKYYNEIHNLIPCLEHGLKMTNILGRIRLDCIADDCRKDILHFISQREINLVEVLKDWSDPRLNDHQVSIFNKVQSQVLEFLKEYSDEFSS